MPKPKSSKPILKLVPLLPWLQKVVNGIEYCVHKPSCKGGIHIRGLAKLCGVDEKTIRSIIRNAKKDKVNLRAFRESEIGNLLKDKTIFLDDLRALEIKKRGGYMKIICADVCADFISYYAKQEKPEARNSLFLFVKFGIEQFIYIQVGFIPIPESIILNDIEFLIAKETVQVNKSRQEEARFFTNPITGECGIDLKSLSFLCGGVAVRHIEEFLKAQNEPFLNPEQSEPIVKAAICAATLQYFGEVHKPRKTLAQQWNKILDPIVPVLHQKTNYQAPPRTDREMQLEIQVNEHKQEIARLQQLVQNNKVQGNIQWHRIMARLLQKSVPYNFFDMHTEVATNQVTQLLDVLIIQRPHPLPQNLVLPDGLSLSTEFNLLSYKSHQESLTAWAIQELIGHYVGYRKTLANQDDNHLLPKAEQFQLYAVTALYPQALVKEMGADWQATSQKGVYRLFVGGLTIVVIVAREIPAAPHNVAWNLLSHDPELIRYALAQSPLPEDLLQYFNTTTAVLI